MVHDPRQSSYAIIRLIFILSVVLWAGRFGQVFAEGPGSPVGDGTISGIVYHDANRNLELDPGERGVKGVLVSNQHEVVVTDKKGRYALPVDDETVIFITTPSKYRVPLDANNLPQFYYIHQPGGSPESEYPGVPDTGPLPQSIDFPLFPRTTSSPVRAVVMGDTQPYTDEELDFLRDDIAAELAGTKADFAIVLGDMVGDTLPLYDRYKRIMAQIGIPIYNVPGNHDENYDSPDDHYALETFKRHFGPPYYSFDYGKAHFIVLDDVEYLGRNSEGGPHYRGRIGEKQLNWLANDLQLVPDDRLVVLTMHIPLDQVQESGEPLRMTDVDALYDILEKRSHVLALAGHKHTNGHRYLAEEDGWEGGKPLHQIVCGAACGAWWSGPKDERGIPLSYQTDGTPNGYYIFDFHGNTYQARYKAAGQDPAEQMRITLPSDILTTEALDTAQVLVNVYDGGPRSVVEYRTDNQPFQPMDWVVLKDPFFTRLLKQYPVSFKGWTSPRPSSHIWAAPLPADLSPGVHRITVRTTDRYGQTWEGHRVFEVQ
ncbi:calcineurin-like phosphoesterase C-terminal domain-containing protein [Candidatus Neomarinimicrobiota bacterium]